MRGDRAPLLIAVVFALGGRMAYDAERQVHIIAAQRHHDRRGDRLHATNRFHPLHHLPDQAIHFRGRPVRSAGQRRLEHQHIVRLQPGISRPQPSERTDQQRRAREQHQRERHFRDHQELARPLVQRAAARTASFLQRGSQIGIGDRERRKQPEQDHRQRRNPQDEAGHTPIEQRQRLVKPIRIRKPRDVAWRHQQQSAHAPSAQCESQHTADRRQQYTLGQKLANHPPAPGADGRPDRQLPLPHSRARQQQVGDVGTGDQQHKPHRSQQNQQRQPHVVHQGLFHRHHRHCLGRVHPFRISSAEPLAQHLHGGAGLFNRHVSLKTRRGSQVVALIGAVWVGLQRNPYVDQRI